MKNIVTDFMQTLLSLDRLSAKQMLDNHTRQITPIKFIETIAVPALERIGDDWEKGNLALSQIYMSGRICEELID